MPYNTYTAFNFYEFFAQCAASECIMGRSHLSVNKFISETNEQISTKDWTGKPTVGSWQEGLLLVFISALQPLLYIQLKLNFIDVLTNGSLYMKVTHDINKIQSAVKSTTSI
jgi:hypothetical protein